MDVDAGSVDSVADIKGQLAGTSLRLVASEAEATVNLYVLSRERFATGDSLSTGTGVAVAPGIATGLGRLGRGRQHAGPRPAQRSATTSASSPGKEAHKKAAQAVVKDVQT